MGSFSKLTFSDTYTSSCAFIIVYHSQEASITMTDDIPARSQAVLVKDGEAYIGEVATPDIHPNEVLVKGKLRGEDDELKKYEDQLYAYA